MNKKKSKKSNYKKYFGFKENKSFYLSFVLILLICSIFSFSLSYLQNSIEYDRVVYNNDNEVIYINIGDEVNLSDYIYDINMIKSLDFSEEGIFSIDLEYNVLCLNEGEAILNIDYNNGETEKLAFKSKIETSNATINQKLDITLNSNSDYVGTEKVFVKYGSSVYLDNELTKVMTTTRNPIDIPKKSGYEFDGYYTEANGKGYKMISEKGYITNKFKSKFFGKSAELYAKWIQVPKSSKVTLISEYHTDSTNFYVSSGRIYKDVKLTKVVKTDRNKSIPVLKKDGYKFDGYYAGKDGTGKMYITKDGSISAELLNISADTNLYAKWTKDLKKVSIGLVSSVAEVAGTTNVYESYNDAIYLDNEMTKKMTTKENAITIPVRDGYKFGGYYSSPKGKGNKLINENGFITESFTANKYSKNSKIYCYWVSSANKVYKIKLNGQLSTSSGTTTIYEKYDEGIYLDAKANKKMTDKNNNIVIPTKKGYQFDGYYTATSGKGEKLIDSNGYITKEFSNNKFSDNKTIYANWVVKTVYGDVNLDGKVDRVDAATLSRYVDNPKSKKLTSAQLLNADINIDGKVDKIDAKLLEFYMSTILKTIPFTNYKAGDVDLDGKVTRTDGVLLAKALSKTATLDDSQRINADVNLDAKVDALDHNILAYYLSTVISELPYFNYVSGDLTKDGKITRADVTLLSRYLANTTDLDSSQILNADINLDGNVNIIDYKIMNIYLNKKNIKLPYYDYKSGDVDSDGEVTSVDAMMILQYNENSSKLSEKQLINADVNLDGKVDKIDAKLVLSCSVGAITLPFVDYLAGDVNSDGKVNNADLAIVQSYLLKKVTLSNVQKINADVNLDSNINEIDSAILKKYVLGNVKSLPYYDYKAGDVDLDGEITSVDALMIQQYNEKSSKLSAKQLINADVNLDGKIDKLDAKLVLSCSVDAITLPAIDYLVGDVDLDGEITSVDALMILQYNEKSITLSAKQSINADVNLDSKIDKLDAKLVLSCSVGAITLPATDYLAGDVNGDGKINAADVSIVQSYVLNKVTLSAIQKLNADVNLDSKVDSTDVDLLKQYTLGKIKNLPVLD